MEVPSSVKIDLAGLEPQFSDELGVTYFHTVPTVSSDIADLYHGLSVHSSIEELDNVYFDYIAPILDAAEKSGDFDAVDVLSDQESRRYIYACSGDYADFFTHYCYVDGYQTASYQATILPAETDTPILEYNFEEVVKKVAKYTGISVSEDTLRDMVSMCIDSGAADNYYLVTVEDPITGDFFSVSALDYGQELECWHVTSDHLVQRYSSID